MCVKCELETELRVCALLTALCIFCITICACGIVKNGYHAAQLAKYNTYNTYNEIKYRKKQLRKINKVNAIRD